MMICRMKIKTLSERLKMLRMEKQMTQKELAKIANVSQNAITRWENGKSLPNTLAIIRISKFFHISIDYLLGFKE